MQRIYLGLPRGLQNIAISAFSIKEYKTRYGANLVTPYESVDQKSPQSFEIIRRFQSERLKRIVSHAAHNVPYYMEMFRKNKINADEVSLENFSSLIPVLEKESVVADPEKFVSRNLPPEIVRLFTSGTSGSPMPIVCSREARSANYAFFKKTLAQNGGGIRDKSATFAGRVLFSEKESEVFWRKDFFCNTLLMSSYHLTDSTIPKYIAALEEWNPVYIDSYPSAVGEIARYICENKLSPKLDLKFILTSSETLTDAQRGFIEDAFRCQVIDHYGCTELAISAYSQPNGRYLIEPMYSLVEFDPALMPGTASPLCTGLLNEAMPLIRYRIGDVVSDPQFDAAKPFFNQTFARVEGRQDDLIVTPEGRLVGRLDPVFKGLSGIKQSQIIQNRVGELEVLVVPVPDANRDGITTKLTENLRNRTSPKMEIAIQFVDSIPLSRSGKFKSVVSRVRR